MWKDEFDPKLLATLGGAFDLAWEYIRKSPQSFSKDEQACRDDLAAIIVSLAQRGDDNRLRIANRAIQILKNGKERPLYRPDAMPVAEEKRRIL